MSSIEITDNNLSPVNYEALLKEQDAGHYQVTYQRQTFNYRDLFARADAFDVQIFSGKYLFMSQELNIITMLLSSGE
jgi:hypothetical protein